MNSITLESIPWNIVAPLIAVQLLLMVVALINCVKTEHTNGPKWMWALIIIFVSIIGPVAYFTIGRRND